MTTFYAVFDRLNHKHDWISLSICDNPARKDVVVDYQKRNFESWHKASEHPAYEIGVLTLEAESYYDLLESVRRDGIKHGQEYQPQVV